MSERDNGGPAFPPAHDPAPHPSGMTLRDYFAAAALTGLLAHPECMPVGKRDPMHKKAMLVVVEEAYACADAMLQEREWAKDPAFTRPPPENAAETDVGAPKSPIAGLITLQQYAEPRRHIWPSLESARWAIRQQRAGLQRSGALVILGGRMMFDPAKADAYFADAGRRQAARGGRG